MVIHALRELDYRCAVILGVSPLRFVTGRPLRSRPAGFAGLATVMGGGASVVPAGRIPNRWAPPSGAGPQGGRHHEGVGAEGGVVLTDRHIREALAPGKGCDAHCSRNVARWSAMVGPKQDNRQPM